MKRETFLDVAKGIGILLVVLIHSATIQGTVVYVINEFYMPMFFLISGYLFGSKGTYLSVNIVKKNIMKFITYYFYGCGILFLLCCFYSVIFNRNAFPGKSAIYSMLYGRFYDAANVNIVDVFWSGHFWFISAMVSSYILFYLLIYVSEKSLLVEILTSMIYVVYAYALRVTPILLPWCIDVAPVIAVIIYVGYKLGKYKFLSQQINWILIVTEVVAGFICWYWFDSYDLHMRNYGSDGSLFGVIKVTLVGVSGSILMIRIARGIDKIPGVGRLLSFLGQRSLFIFMWHIVWIFAMNILFGKIGGDNSIVKGILMVISVVGGSLLLQLCLDKIKTLYMFLYKSLRSSLGKS